MRNWSATPRGAVPWSARDPLHTGAGGPASGNSSGGGTTHLGGVVFWGYDWEILCYVCEYNALCRDTRVLDGDGFSPEVDDKSSVRGVYSSVSGEEWGFR